VTSEEVHARIRTYVISHFHLSRIAELGDDDSLLDAQLIDSLGILELVGYLEETFAIQVTDDELTPENFDSIGALARFVSKRSEQQ
jgi:acyl carrier protein